MLRAYWIRILIFAAAFGGIALLVSLLIPRKYDAVLQILVDNKQLQAQRATTPAEENIADLLDFGRSRSVTTTVEQLTSLGVMQRAAETVARARNIEITGQDSELFPINLQAATTVQAAQESDIVTLRVRLSSAELAQDVAREIYAAFDALNLSNSRTSADVASQSLQTLIDAIGSQLRTVDGQLQAVRQKYNLASVEAETQANTQTIAQLKSNRDNLRVELNGLEARVATLEDQVAATPALIRTQNTDTVNPIAQQLDQQIASVRADLERTRARFFDDSPQVREATAALNKLLSERRAVQNKIRSNEADAVNPVRSQLLSELAVTRSNRDAARERLLEAEAVLASREEEVQRLPVAQREIQDLTRRQDSLEQSYVQALNRLETLKASDSARSAVTKVVTPATGIPIPAVPNVPLNTTLGLFVGAVIGILSSFATESKRRPIRTVGQLNQLTLAPSFHVVPELRAPFRGLDRSPHEAFESLLVNFAKSGKKGYRLGVVGVNRGAGASTTALNLAIAGATKGYKVNLIVFGPTDAVARRLRAAGVDVNQGFGSPGMVEVSSADQRKALVDGLKTGAVGSEMGAGDADLIILDFLPASASGDYAFIARNVDEMLLLVQAGRTRSIDFIRIQQALADSGCPLVTTALSRATDGGDDLTTASAADEESKALART